MGQDDQITMTDWYAGQWDIGKNVDRLQVVTDGADFNAASTDRLFNQKVVVFDFRKLVADFDQARAADPALAEWSAQNSLAAAYQSGSNARAIGGDLAYRFATLNDKATLVASYGNLAWPDVRDRMNGLSGYLQNLTVQPLSPVNPWIALQAGTSLIVEQPTGASLPITAMQPLTQDELMMAALASQQQATGQSKPSWA